MKKIIVLVIGIIFLSGCAEIDRDNTGASSKITTRCFRLGSFNSIVISGNAKVRFVNSRCNQITVTGMNVDKYDCRNSIINQVLYVNSANKVPMTGATITGSDSSTVRVTDAVIEIGSTSLRNLTVTDNATVDACKFKANHLTITAKDYSNINLDGWLNIDKIFQYGSGRINLGWVNSCSLYIAGEGSGPIYLGGRVDDLVVKLVKDAKLHAHYLRALKANVFTADRAFAEVLVLNTLGAFAVDNSNIYYHKRLKDLTVVTKGHGNVLYMGWIR